MCHEESDLNQTISHMMQTEQENEITKISTMQGYSIGLIAFLLKKGIMSSDEVSVWENYSEQAAAILKTVLGVGNKLEQDQFSSEIEMLELRKQFLNANIQFGRLLHHENSRISKLEEEFQRCENRLEELRNEA